MGRNFLEAVRALSKDNVRIRRKSWRDDEYAYAEQGELTINRLHPEYKQFIPSIVDILAEDWEDIQTLDFAAALEKMKDGYYVRRMSWPRTEIDWHIQDGKIVNRVGRPCPMLVENLEATDWILSSCQN